MTDSTEYELAETLGEAAAHERAAGEMGKYLKKDKLDSHNAEDVIQRLPDRQEVDGHFNAYIDMIEEIREDTNDHVPECSYRDHIPEGDVLEEHALLMGYVLERQARENAQEAINEAKDTEYHFLITGTTGELPYSLSDIAREENEEMIEIEDLLTGDEEYDFEDEEELEEFETLEDVAEAFT